MVEDQVLIGGVFVLFGGLMAYRSVMTYREQQAIAGINQNSLSATGTDGTDPQLIEGELQVSEPVTPTVVPAVLTDSISRPGLWAWRIQRKQSRNSGSSRTRYRWRTVDGELATGDISVYTDGRSLDIDDAVLDSLTVEPNQSTLDLSNVGDLPVETGSSDPLDNDQLYLDDTIQTVDLADSGFLQDVLPDSVTVSFGQVTSDPDRYEAAVLEDGDRVWITGTIDRTADGDVITTSETATFRLLDRDPESVQQSLRKKAMRSGVIGTVLIGIGIVVATGLAPG